jgi:hypothetical protein
MDEAQQNAKYLQPIYDRMVQVGWANKYAYSDKGIVVDWTEHGKDRLRLLWEIWKELSPIAMQSGTHFWAVVISAATHYGWK